MSPPGGSPAAADIPAPVAFTGLVQRSWSLYRRNFASLFVLFLPLGAAFFIAIIPLLVLPRGGVKAGNGAPLSTSLTLTLLTVIPVLVGGIAVAIATVLVTDRLVGRASTAADAFRKARPLLGVLFAAGLVSSLVSIVLRMVALPFAFFVQPLLYGPVILAQVIALEGTNLKLGLARAGALLEGEKVRTFMYLFGLSLGISLLDLMLLGLMGTALTQIDNDVIIFTGGTLVAIAVPALLVPFIAMAMLISYFDLRARKEDLDLEELTAEREARG